MEFIQAHPSYCASPQVADTSASATEEDAQLRVLDYCVVALSACLDISDNVVELLEQCRPCVVNLYQSLQDMFLDWDEDEDDIDEEKFRGKESRVVGCIDALSKEHECNLEELIVLHVCYAYCAHGSVIPDQLQLDSNIAVCKGLEQQKKVNNTQLWSFLIDMLSSSLLHRGFKQPRRQCEAQGEFIEEINRIEQEIAQEIAQEHNSLEADLDPYSEALTRAIEGGCSWCREWCIKHVSRGVDVTS